jgi:hypothetical protein
MIFGFAIIIKLPRVFHRRKKAKVIKENVNCSTGSLSRYLNTADKYPSEIDSLEVTDECRFKRSAAPSPEPPKEIGQNAGGFDKRD